MIFPVWTYLGLAAVSIGVLGTLFDKYLLEKYFANHEADDAGPGALLIFSSFFAIFIVGGIYYFSHSSISFNLNYGLIGLTAGTFNGIWILLYLYAIHRTDVSRALPIFQIIPAFGLVIAYFTLGETVTFIQMFAIATIIFGALVLLYVKKDGFFTIDSTTMYLMLTASFFIALSHAVFKIAAVGSNYATATFWLWSGFVLFGIMLFFFCADYHKQFKYLIKRRLKNVVLTNGANEIFDNLSELIFFAAVLIGPIALVQSLNAYEPIFVLVISILMAKIAPKYFNEELTTAIVIQKIIGVLIITFGSVILYSML